MLSTCISYFFWFVNYKHNCLRWHCFASHKSQILVKFQVGTNIVSPKSSTSPSPQLNVSYPKQILMCFSNCAYLLYKLNILEVEEDINSFQVRSHWCFSHRQVITHAMCVLKQNPRSNGFRWQFQVVEAAKPWVHCLENESLFRAV